MTGTLIYDADCGFCTVSARWLARGAEQRLTIEPWQGVEDLGALGLTEDMVTTAAYWVVGGRQVAGGSDAIAAALVAKGLPWSFAGRVIAFPLVRPLARLVYGVIARNRQRMPGGTDACKLPPA